MRKKILTIMAVLFALCVIGFIYKLQTDYYVKFDAKIPDTMTVEYGEKFEMPEVMPWRSIICWERKRMWK